MVAQLLALSFRTPRPICAQPGRNSSPHWPNTLQRYPQHPAASISASSIQPPASHLFYTSGLDWHKPFPCRWMDKTLACHELIGPRDPKSRLFSICVLALISQSAPFPHAHSLARDLPDEGAHSRAESGQTKGQRSRRLVHLLDPVSQPASQLASQLASQRRGNALRVSRARTQSLVGYHSCVLQP